MATRDFLLTLPVPKMRAEVVSDVLQLVLQFLTYEEMFFPRGDDDGSSVRESIFRRANEKINSKMGPISLVCKSWQHECKRSLTNYRKLNFIATSLMPEKDL